jgi:hypothetical protein
MMLRSKNFQLAFHLTVTLLWPATTYAASVTLGTTLGQVPPVAWFIVLALSVVSGLVSLLQRIKEEMKTPEGDAALKRTWRWYTAAHMLGALFVGLLAFLFAEGAELRDFFEAIFIAAMSWGGARVMDKLADGLTDGIVMRVVSLIGGQPPARKE